MPGKDELRATLLATLQAPLQQFVALLQAPAQNLVYVLAAKERAGSRRLTLDVTDADANCRERAQFEDSRSFDYVHGDYHHG